MTVGELEDAKAACKKALEVYQEDSVIVSLSAPDTEAEELLKQIAGARGIPSVRICHVDFAALPELEIEDNYAEVALEKQDWKAVEGVNVTLGLPIIRASVDHGTDFYHAGKGNGNELSLVNAIKYAVKMTGREA